MALSAEQIKAVADAIASWQLQEYIFIAFYCFYFYYVLTTMDEEVSVILPQRWNRGKTLYVIIRYGILAVISLQLSRDYKNHFSISPGGCKALYFLNDVIYRVVILACNFSLALCLSALLRAKILYCIGIVALSCALPVVSAILNLMLIIQYPAQPISVLDTELGYPCYAPSAEEWAEHTPGFLYTGRDIRAYLNLVFTTLLALLGVVTFIVRYKGQGGGLVRVITRDGGMHYLFQLALKLSSAIILTPKLVAPSSLHSNPAYLILSSASQVVIPVLAQRLLINMRKVDYMGSEPVASKLLFAPPAPGSEDDLDSDLSSFEIASEAPSPRDKGVVGVTSKKPNAVGASNLA